MVAEAPHVSKETLASLEATLLNTSGKVPLDKRYRALFTIKALQNEHAVDIIAKAHVFKCQGFSDDSALLKHELAYVLGQMNMTSALPVLESVLKDKQEDPMVRHECAEAMGAIGSLSSVPVLQQYVDDPERVVRETCDIAIDRIQWAHSEEGQKHRAQSQEGDQLYTSVDPAPATSGLLSGKGAPADASESNIAKLKAQLLDTNISLFERYRAMFALRNIGTPAAVDALAAGFSDDSALFKHEIAFVFGQLLSPHSIPYLVEVLRDPKEADVVRHEAAEALGGIATPNVLPHLKEWLAREDSPKIVRESCQVALDMYEYENSNEFQYADGLDTTHTAVAV
ncbi:hypothetical protein EW026_g3449 [Hermanssonia centrifuga]|uniref:Deoxyhypusine hydroxylase n=1 Tax=Hermanssonia centrifuga TaxID=98765 RepID=A0A4S4KK71_9APHY|nr:hypothetical protein EW026_g3449 [Hermanssonia centrifuga]